MAWMVICPTAPLSAVASTDAPPLMVRLAALMVIPERPGPGVPSALIAEASPSSRRRSAVIVRSPDSPTRTARDDRPAARDLHRVRRAAVTLPRRPSASALTGREAIKASVPCTRMVLAATSRSPASPAPLAIVPIIDEAPTSIESARTRTDPPAPVSNVMAPIPLKSSSAPVLDATMSPAATATSPPRPLPVAMPAIPDVSKTASVPRAWTSMPGPRASCSSLLVATMLSVSIRMSCALTLILPGGSFGDAGRRHDHCLVRHRYVAEPRKTRYILALPWAGRVTDYVAAGTDADQMNTSAGRLEFRSAESQVTTNQGDRLSRRPLYQRRCAVDRIAADDDLPGRRSEESERCGIRTGQYRVTWVGRVEPPAILELDYIRG